MTILQAMGNDFWAIQRGHYSSIAGLVTKVDDAVSMITAFSLSNNLYYILIQLLHSFQYDDNETLMSEK